MTPESTSRVGRWAVALVTATLSIAAAAVTWWVFVATGTTIDDPDYYMEPLQGLLDARVAIGVTAVAIGALCISTLVWLRRRGARVPVGVVVCVVGIGVVVGGAYSVFTAPVIGANIGAGIAMFGAPLLVVALAIQAVARSRP